MTILGIKRLTRCPGQPQNKQTMSKKSKRKEGNRDGEGGKLPSKRSKVSPATPIPTRRNPIAHDHYCRSQLAPRSRGTKDLLMRVFLLNELDLTPILWTRVTAALGPDSHLVHKITRKTPPGMEPMFDLIISAKAKDTLIGTLCKHSKKNNYDWWIQADDGQAPRPRRVAPAPKPPTAEEESASLRLMTWNIDGILTKAVEVDTWVKELGADVVGLQETKLKPGDRTPRFRGYTSHHGYGKNTEFRRGVSILTKESLVVQRTPINDNPNQIFRRIVYPEKSIVVGSVYLPSKKNGKKFRLDLKRSLARLRVVYPEDPIVTMGDWNMSPKEVDKLLEEWRQEVPDLKRATTTMVLDQTEDEPVKVHTYRSGAAKTCIDHFVALGVTGHPSAKSHWSVDAACHFPVTLDLKVPKQGGSTAGAREGNPRLRLGNLPLPPYAALKVEDYEYPAKYLEFVNDPCWDDLRELADSDVGQSETARTALGEEMALYYRTNMVEVGVRCGAMASRGGKHRRGNGTPKKIRRAVLARSKARMQAIREKDPLTALNKWKNYVRLKARAMLEIKNWKKAKASNKIAEAAKGYISNPRGFWQWAADQYEDVGGASHSAETLLDEETGLLVSDPEQINKLWARHYGDLAKDPMKDTEAPWTANWAAWKRRHAGGAGPRPTIEGLEEEISWDEVLAAIKSMKNHKAPGDDGIPAEFLKLATRIHQCAFGKALLAVLRNLRGLPNIPKEWATATNVSISKPGGDPTLMTDYRGISLMPSILKLLVAIMIRRVDKAFEDKGLYHKSQAGFRSKEECPLQAAALFDITKMRMKSSAPFEVKGTYLLFVDLKKAYDTVPHDLLFKKLEWWGVRDSTLSFFKTLYRNSVFRVRSGGLPGILSEACELNRGLRQGCPASPTLFNIFINDIFWFEKGKDLGVPDPSCEDNTRKERLAPRIRIPGLLFADDLVAILPKKHVRPMCAHLTEWARCMGMSFGIKKCGLMGHEQEAQAWLRQEMAENGPFLLGGEELPLVNEYKYLGLWFNDELSLDYMAQRRTELGEAALLRVQAYLCWSKVPLHLRVAVIRQVLILKMIYGAELWGTNVKRVEAGQKIVNEALRMVVGAQRSDRMVHLLGLWRELNVPPLRATIKARMVRGYAKAHYLRTFIKDVAKLQGEWAPAARTWTMKTLPVLAANSKIPELRFLSTETADRVRGVPVDGMDPLRPKELSRCVEKLVWEEITAKSVRTAKRSSLKYQAYMTKAQEGTMRQCRYLNPELTKGVELLLRMRTKTVWTAARLAERGIWKRRWLRRCPCCEGNRRETEAHLVLRCGEFHVERQQIQGTILVAKRLLGKNASDDKVLALTIGGSVNRPGLQPVSIGDYTREHLTGVTAFLTKVARKRAGLVQRVSLSATCAGR